MDDINQIRYLVNQAILEERRASDDMHNLEFQANHEQSQLDTCLTYKKECVSGLKSAKDSGLSIVQIRECQLLVQYLDSVVETRQYKADISQENYQEARTIWQEKQESLKNLRQQLKKLEAENHDESKGQPEMLHGNRLANKGTYKIYNGKKL